MLKILKSQITLKSWLSRAFYNSNQHHHTQNPNRYHALPHPQPLTHTISGPHLSFLGSFCGSFPSHWMPFRSTLLSQRVTGAASPIEARPTKQRTPTPAIGSLNHPEANVRLRGSVLFRFGSVWVEGVCVQLFSTPRPRHPPNCYRPQT